MKTIAMCLIILLLTISVALSAPMTAGYIQKAKTGTIIVDSVVYENTSNIGIGSTLPRQKLEVVGSIQATGFIADGNVGVSTTAPTTCGCKQYTDGLCTTVGTCS